MSKEIERKWLWDYSLYFDFEALYSSAPYLLIKDYYFNEFCRLRYTEDHFSSDEDLLLLPEECRKRKNWEITIKSVGNLVRDEFTFPIDSSQYIDFLPNPVLKKIRYYFQEDDYTYEVNIFDNIMIGVFPLITVELELPSPSLVIDKLPDYCGKEITNDMSYYGYNLFKFLKDATDKNMSGPHKDNVIQLRKILDKSK
jgi:CYTH domain-containing protein